MNAYRTQYHLPSTKGIVRPGRAIRGFTLIELLVVISIIALLVGILLPALGAARRTAIVLKCTTQIRQIGIANASFETDHGHFVPSWEKEGSSWTDSYHARNSWKEALYDGGYAPAAEVFLCPIVADEGTQNPNASDPKNEEPFSNYRINHQLGGPKDGYTTEGSVNYHHPLSSDDVLRPSRTIIFTDNTTYSGFLWGGSMIFVDWGHLQVSHLQSMGNSWYFSPWGPKKISNGTTSFAMVDGSASAMSVTEDRYAQYDNTQLNNEEYFLTPDGNW